MKKKVHLPKESTSSTGYVVISSLLQMLLCNYVEILVYFQCIIFYELKEFYIRLFEGLPILFSLILINMLIVNSENNFQ